MKELKGVGQLTKGCSVTYIKGDNSHHYEFLMVHPNSDKEYLFIDGWSQEVVRIYIGNLLNGDYYIGKYDTIFILQKCIDFHKRMIKSCEKRIEEVKQLKDK